MRYTRLGQKGLPGLMRTNQEPPRTNQEQGQERTQNIHENESGTKCKQRGNDRSVTVT